MRNLTNQEAEVLVERLLANGSLTETNDGNYYDVHGRYFEPLDESILELILSDHLDTILS